MLAVGNSAGQRRIDDLSNPVAAQDAVTKSYLDSLVSVYVDIVDSLGGIFTVYPQVPNGVHRNHEYVDLGLPSGTKWATCNVGASNPEDCGNFYAWGETSPKEVYSDSTYTYHNNPTTLPSNKDAATVNWGKEWSTPTQEQWNELCDTTLCHWTQQKKGFLVTSKKNGKSIFLPACGMYYGKEAPKTFLNEGDSVRYDGHYWTATLSGVGKEMHLASVVGFNTGYQRMRLPVVSMAELCYGMSIRPVAKLPE